VRASGLTQSDGLERFLELLSTTDVLVHGYRADALERLDWAVTFATPFVRDSSTSAWTRTGGRAVEEPSRFDSLVQMSSGIADAGGSPRASTRQCPFPCRRSITPPGT